MERFNMLAGSQGQTARAIKLDEALAALPGLNNNARPIPSLFVVVSVTATWFREVLVHNAEASEYVTR